MGSENDRYFSTELCGGTHVRNTGDIGKFELSDETRELGGNKVKQCVNTYKEYFIDKRSKLNDYTIRGIL